VTKTVLETTLKAELSEHLGYDKQDPAGRNRGNPARAPDTQLP
jgi:putative transposase